MQRTAILFSFALFLLALCASCQRAKSQEPAPTAAPVQKAQGEEKDPVASPPPLPKGVHRGICLAHNWQDRGQKGYGSQASLESKKELKALGADWMSITPFGWQKTLQSTHVGYDPNMAAGENDKRLVREFQQARELGMKIMLKPHLWINDKDWRGHIQPEGDKWESWFASYQKFILHYAKLAETHQVEAFVIGVELASSSWHQRDLWVSLIEEIRKVYSGKITYASNWNEAQRVLFWDKVDWIGVQFFPPVSEKLDPSPQELAQNIGKHLDGYEKLSKHYNKPVILTEYGYKSVRATAAAPHTWPEHLPAEGKEYHEENQARAFSALLTEAGKRDFIQGVYLWKWFTNVNTDEEGKIGFSPRQKMAARILQSAYAAQPKE